MVDSEAAAWTSTHGESKATVTWCTAAPRAVGYYQGAAKAVAEEDNQAVLVICLDRPAVDSVETSDPTTPPESDPTRSARRTDHAAT